MNLIKTTSLVGKVVFYLLYIILLYSSVRGYTEVPYGYRKKQNPIYLILTLVLFFHLLRFVFRRIYQFGYWVYSYETKEINSKEFSKRWNYSLICTILASFFVVTIPFLIPQYILLINTKKYKNV